MFPYLDKKPQVDILGFWFSPADLTVLVVSDIHSLWEREEIGE